MLDNFIILVGRLAGLFSLAWLGWFIVQRRWLDGSAMRALAWIVVDITLPALIFVGISRLSLDLRAGLGLLIGGFAVSALGLALAWPFSMLKNVDKRGTFLFTVAIANSSFLPLPLATALWGEAGTQACLVYVLGNNVFLLSVGISLFRLDGAGPKNIDFTMLYRHPQALAGLLGLGVLGMGWRLPDWAHGTLEALGSSTIPMAMLATGGLIAAAGRNMAENKAVLGLSLALKGLVLPAAVLLGLKMLGIQGLLAGLLLLQACMPSLASAAAYASRFDGDPVLAGNASFWSSLAALGLIPAWMALGGGLLGF